MTKNDIEQKLHISLTCIAALGVRGLTEDELVGLFTSAYEIEPTVLVEIGACQGVASTILGHVAAECSGHLFSFDCKIQPGWQQNIDRYLLSSFATLIYAVSPDLDIATLPFKVIDYLLIDGDHSYDGAMNDYIFWSKLVRPGGRIAFHDYYSHKEVRQAVSEIITSGHLLPVMEVPGKMYNDPGSSLDNAGLVIFEKL